MSSKARKKKPKVKKVKWGDKKWIKIFAPKIFNNKEIGEIIGLEDTIIGRTVETLLYDFTGKYSDISLKLLFKITNANFEAGRAETIFVSHQYTSDYIRSLIGRGSSKIQIIKNLTTKDGYIFRVTGICTTIKRARSSQIDLIRKIMDEVLREFASLYNHEKFIKAMISRELDNQIQRVAKTIYPLSNSVLIKSKLISIPEGGEDKEVPDEQFDIIEVDVKRSRKSEIRRSERINVKKLWHPKNAPQSKDESSEPNSSENNSSEESED
ncbi:MAG: 30S ribosomal protein S3ae [Candidatus Odinarchaeota archaeon]